MLVEMQRSRFSVFSWPRGRPRLWRLSVDRRGRRPPLLVYEEGWPDPWDNPYRPLEDAPRLYEEFAEVGRLAFRRGAQLTGTAEEAAFWPYDVEVEGGEGGLITRRFKRPMQLVLAESTDEELAKGVTSMGLLPRDEQVAATSAKDPRFQKTALAFVRAFGPLRDLTEAERRPRRRGRQRLMGMPLAELLREAWLLYQAIRLVEEVREGEEEGLGGEDFRARQVWLQDRVSHRLRGISPILAYDTDSGRLVPAFSCADLLSAIWLQFYESLAAGRTWRTCKGCGRLFTPADARQEYHDVACRNRTHARLFGRRSRGEKNG